MVFPYILILFVHVGALGDGNSNALSMQEFYSQQTCEAAGRAAANLASGTVKRIEYVCVKK